MQWQFKSQQPPATTEELKQILLANRQLEADSTFFSPPHPLELSLASVGIDSEQMKLACKRILQAIDKKEELIIFGDYDADGICATAILWQTLYELGAKVMPFIPHRKKHGYGLSKKALTDLLKDHQPALIITVDNGIVAHQPAQQVLDSGIDLIITDHHQPEAELAPATAVIHSTQLCGATVSWFLAREIKRAKKKALAKNWQLDLAAIATIADQVSLRAANRSFAYHGLIALRKTARIGLKALLKLSHQAQTSLDSQSIGFSLAPRINAMGRLGHGLDALRLLLTTNSSRAQRLAKTLNETNTERQNLTYEMYGQALAQADQWKDEYLIVTHSADYHPGVMGLIAGRLVNTFHKPAIVLSLGSTVAKASARSVPGVNIVELIRKVKADLIEVGGHPMAAGFSVKIEQMEPVIAKLQTLAKETIDRQLLKPTLEIDATIPFSLANLKTIEMIQEFAPFGQDNPEPILAIEEVEVVKALTLGQEDRHLKILATDQHSVEPLELLFWKHGDLAEKLSPKQKIKVAGQLEINEWNGQRSPQMRLLSIKE